MVQPHILHPNVLVNDITKVFRSSASRLSAGRLVKDEHFTLFEAVSALEIGDPKMDSGCLAADLDVEDFFDFQAPVSPREVIWLMDELMYREVAWHQGYPLSQTLFTSVHLEKLLWPEPKRLSEARFDRNDLQTTSTPSILKEILRPFSLALIKCCDLILTMILGQHYYEEEDFATQVFNRPLLHNIPIEDVLLVLETARLQLHLLDLDVQAYDAIKARLDLRCSLLLMLRDCGNGTRPDLVRIGALMILIDTMEKSAHLGEAPIEDAFTLKIQHRLASSVPPRPMIVTERAESFKCLRQLFSDASRVFEVLDIACPTDLLVAYQSLMAQKPQPSVYVRALLQSFLTLQNSILGRFSARQFILQDLRLLVLPNSPLVEDDSIISPPLRNEQFEVLSQFNFFVNRCGQSYLNLFRTFCLNRCRVRRTLCHAALEWDQMQAEAEELDGLVQSAFGEQPRLYPGMDEPTFSYSLSSWVYHYKMMQLRSIVQTGFELSIYAPHEYAGLYWYLSYLTNTHLSHLERISFFVSPSEQVNSLQHQNLQTTLQQLYRQFTWLKATEALAKAVHRVLIVIQRHGHLTTPKFTYSSDHLRYELRMRPFQHLSIPEPVSPDVAQKAFLLQEMSDSMILEQALRLNQTAKKAWEEVLKENWNFQSLSSNTFEENAIEPGNPLVIEREWKKGVRNSIKACIGTGIAISTLMKGLQDSESQKGIRTMKIDIPQVGDKDRWHPAWAVPKVFN